ncbi:hypothetical protein RB653_001117 [Dictyostelium firmibasis]|uniref:Transmembrane protein n=1 Tax=Dictyostelium firmibasis TaxID=79012 RepID=A0AAN7YR79_9MYCE
MKKTFVYFILLFYTINLIYGYSYTSKVKLADMNFIKKAHIYEPNVCYFLNGGTLFGIHLNETSIDIIHFIEINYNKNDKIPNEIIMAKSNFSLTTIGSVWGKKNKIPSEFEKKDEFIIYNDLKDVKNSYIANPSMIYNNEYQYNVIGMTYQSSNEYQQFIRPFGISFLEEFGFEQTIPTNEMWRNENKQKKPDFKEIINYIDRSIYVFGSIEEVQSFKSCHNKITNIYYAFIKDYYQNQFIVQFNGTDKSLKSIPFDSEMFFYTTQISEYQGIFVIAGTDRVSGDFGIYSVNLKTKEKTLIHSGVYQPTFYIKSENTRYLMFYTSQESCITIYDILKKKSKEIIINTKINEKIAKNIDSAYAVYYGDNQNEEFQFLREPINPKAFISTLKMDTNNIQNNLNNKLWLKVFIPVLTISIISLIVLAIIVVIFKRRKISKKQFVNFN